MATIGNLDLSKLGKHELKSLPGGETVQMESLWKDKTCVIIFFRRWGCAFCRLWAKELSEMAPVLKENDVRFVGVGVEDLGADEFVNGNFFDGELYVDKERTIYKELKFKRFNWPSILLSLFSSESRTAVQKGRSLKLGGDYRGDGLQNGGALVVAAGGEKVLLSFLQERPAEHLPNSKFLEALGLTEKAATQDDAGLTEKAATDAGLTEKAATQDESGPTEKADTQNESGVTEKSDTQNESGLTKKADTQNESGLTEKADTQNESGLTEKADTQNESGLTEKAVTQNESGLTEKAVTQSDAGLTEKATTQSDAGLTEKAASE